jgi:hypothetical protein
MGAAQARPAAPASAAPTRDAGARSADIDCEPESCERVSRALTQVFSRGLDDGGGS